MLASQRKRIVAEQREAAKERARNMNIKLAKGASEYEGPARLEREGAATADAAGGAEDGEEEAGAAGGAPSAPGPAAASQPAGAVSALYAFGLGEDVEGEDLYYSSSESQGGQGEEEDAHA